MAAAVLAGAMAFGLGWSAGRIARGRSDARAAAPPPARAVMAGGGPLRVPKLRALDVVVDVDQIPDLASAKVAELGAKKWTEVLATAVERAPLLARFGVQGRDEQLADYLAGWLSVVGQTTPYSENQFSDSLGQELCPGRAAERRLLQELSPGLPTHVLPVCRDGAPP